MNNNYEDLYRIFDKEVINVDTLRHLADDSRVVSITNQKSRKWQFNRYDVKLDNEELYIVYIKKSLFELLKWH